MVTGEPTPKRISAAELDAVLDRARSEEWPELALIGPRNVNYAELDDGVPEARTFVLKEALGPRITKLAYLVSLTKLSIRGIGIGEEVPWLSSTEGHARKALSAGCSNEPR